MTIARRSFITGLISLVAAPAIVRAGSLMPVKSMVDPNFSGRAILLMQQSALLDAQRLINFRRAVMLEFINSHSIQPYSLLNYDVQ